MRSSKRQASLVFVFLQASLPLCSYSERSRELVEKTSADRAFLWRKVDKSKKTSHSTSEKRKSGDMEGNSEISLHCDGFIFKSQSNSLYERLHELFSPCCLIFPTSLIRGLIQPIGHMEVCTTEVSSEISLVQRTI